MEVKGAPGPNTNNIIAGDHLRGTKRVREETGPKASHKSKARHARLAKRARREDDERSQQEPQPPLIQAVIPSSSALQNFGDDGASWYGGLPHELWGVVIGSSQNLQDFCALRSVCKFFFQIIHETSDFLAVTSEKRAFPPLCLSGFGQLGTVAFSNVTLARNAFVGLNNVTHMRLSNVIGVERLLLPPKIESVSVRSCLINSLKFLRSPNPLVVALEKVTMTEMCWADEAMLAENLIAVTSLSLKKCSFRLEAMYALMALPNIKNFTRLGGPWTALMAYHAGQATHWETLQIGPIDRKVIKKLDLSRHENLKSLSLERIYTPTVTMVEDLEKLAQHLPPRLQSLSVSFCEEKKATIDLIAEKAPLCLPHGTQINFVLPVQGEENVITWTTKYEERHYQDVEVARQLLVAEGKGNK